MEVKNIAVIGSSGAIGNAFVNQLAKLYPDAHIHAFARHHTEKAENNIFRHSIAYDSESSIEEAAALASKDLPLNMVIVATGILHDEKLTPEKSLKDLLAEKFQRSFAANTITPALIAKYFLPRLDKNNQSIFAALSARVGSVSDNKLGGWYAYRASKAALNMVIKTAAVEINRFHKKAIVVSLHPGTVMSNLSEPFQKNVPKEKLFTPEFSATKMLDVLNNLTPEDSGKCFAWDGAEIEP